MDNADDDTATRHVARKYQEELFSIARRQNVIAALETGSGKTFIAAMLIKSICADPSSRDKRVVFLVPKVPLVNQQRDFLEKQTPLRIRGYKGEMGVDNWDKTTWHREFDSADVLVMTAQVFKNILTHGYWHIDKVSLLVFDECHHARNKHPFNTIMTDHYVDCEIKNRPKIFGMTASPVWNDKDPAASIHTLQYNLFAQVFVVKQHFQELHHHAPRPKEIIVRYASPPPVYADYPDPSLWTELEKEQAVASIGRSINFFKARYEKTRDSLGPAAAEYYLHNMLSAKVQDNTCDEDDDLIRLRKRPRLDFSIKSHGHETKDSASSTIQAHKALRLILESAKSRLYVDVIPLTWMAPKYVALVKLLKQHESASFRGILFVEQRQIATSLSWLLTRTPETRAWIKCAELMGHGDLRGTGDVLQGMGLKSQENIVKSFRNGGLNMIIATSVAEEGLDFPACELVIRFDPIQTMVAYVQSRGRARQKASTFVVMIDEDDPAEFARYSKLRDAEPEMKKAYQQNKQDVADVDQEEDEDREDPRDLEDREVYVVQSTGATLTYNSAIMLLNRLCSFIPRDSFSTPCTPTYTITDSATASAGKYNARLTLPTALPTQLRETDGPAKNSKKEAKRAVAFRVVRALHELGVYDDHLSPSKRRKGDAVEDADGLRIPHVKDVPEFMEVMVKYPWCLGSPWYLHILTVDGTQCAGLVTGSRLPALDFKAGITRVVVDSAVIGPLELGTEEEQVMDQYTRMGIWWCITASPVPSKLACYLVPLATDGHPDWEMMRDAIKQPKGSYDWSHITSRYERKLVLMNSRVFGKTLMLIRIRKDVHLSDECPLGGSAGQCDSEIETYAQYFARVYPGTSVAPMDSSIIEVMPYKKAPSPIYTLRVGEEKMSEGEESTSSDCESMKTFLLPQWYCKNAPISSGVLCALRILSPLCQRITDLHRAHQAVVQLGLPEINLDRMVEALVIPSAMAGFNNQRLETLGDSVLKLSVVTYVYNRFPFKHEGQLDQLKGASISNRCLLARGKHLGLEAYISSENRAAKSWQFVLDQPEVDEATSCGTARCCVPRRSMQDCMEATLGAAYLTGGIEMALRAGAALGLCFGGGEPWHTRYGMQQEASSPGPAMFVALQERLGYTFRNARLLVEAVTHPSYKESDGSCYQRLEFLGDAVMDLITSTHVFDTFPTANSGQMSWMRSHLICNSTFATVAVKRFLLHKYILSNNVELSKAVAEHVEVLEAASYDDVVQKSWKYDPPKVLGDVFESVIGAVFVDSNFDFELTKKIARTALEDVLPHVHIDMPKDPVSKLYVLVGKAGCRKIRFKKAQVNPEGGGGRSVEVLVHDTVVAGPAKASTVALAKAAASVEALDVLRAEDSEFSLVKLCDCMVIEEDESPDPREVREKDLDNETVEGFVALSELRTDEAAREEAAAASPRSVMSEEVDEILEEAR